MSRFVLVETGLGPRLVNTDDVPMVEPSSSDPEHRSRIWIGEVNGDSWLDVPLPLAEVQALLSGVTTETLTAHPNLIGWQQQYPHPSSLLPSTGPSWAPRKAGAS